MIRQKKLRTLAQFLPRISLFPSFSLSLFFSPSIPFGTGLNSLSNSAASVLIGREDMPENVFTMCGPSCRYSAKLLTSNKLENAGDFSQMLCNYLNFKKGATTDREHRRVKMTAVVCTETYLPNRSCGAWYARIN